MEITQEDIDRAELDRDAAELAYHELDLKCGYEPNPDTRFELKKGLNPAYIVWQDAKDAYYHLTEDFYTQNRKYKEEAASKEMSVILKNIAAKQKRTEELHRKTLLWNEKKLAERETT